MAEQEIVNHTKKIYKTWKNPQISIWHKVKEIALEVFIIVFAVTLSIGLHNWNESRHNKHEAHLFLEGLKNDLAEDTLQMQSDGNSYLSVKNAIDYFITIGEGKVIEQDSVKKYSKFFYNTTHFNANSSRFEALKGSGKLGIITNKELLKEILNYYQSSIPYINLQNETYSELKKNIPTTFQKNAVYTNDAQYDLGKMLTLPEIRHTLKMLNTSPKEIANTYQKKIERTRKIIVQIETELK
jgi:hypothetical protein